MTYCLAIATHEGLVFCSDSRTNAGPDVLSTYSKMHSYALDNERLVVLLSAGNLATTQAVISQIDSDLEEGAETSLKTCQKMSDVANYVGKISREQQREVDESTGDSDIDVSASFIVGGQIAGADPHVYLVYPAGNHISYSEATPYLQIGESKYGKPILDRILSLDTCLEDAARCALVSMDSTLRANATVGPPVEILVYDRDSFGADHRFSLSGEDSYLLTLNKAWNEALKEAFMNLPRFHWQERSATLVEAPPLAKRD